MSRSPVLRRALVSVGPVALAFVVGAATDRLVHAGPKAHDASPHAMLEQLGRALVLVENEYVDPVDRGRLVEGAIRGMVAELDPHSEYFNAKELAEFAEETEGRFGGVGIEVEVSGGQLTVVAPIEGGPAARAGVRPGDRVVAIDGKDVRGGHFDKLLHTLRGAPGTSVTVVVTRANEPGRLTFVLVREEIKMPSVDVAPLPKSVGYVRVRQFQERSHADFVAAVGKLRGLLSGHLDGVVLDLRRNPGGLVDQATGIADEILDEGVIFSMRGHNGDLEQESKARSGGALVGTPVVVLVDDGSASAAELLAGALQDHHRATIVGIETFGKGSVQSVFNLPDGSGAVKLTTARYYTPSGRAIQARGIVPDIVVDSTRVLDAKEQPTSLTKERDLPHALPPEGPTPAASTSAAPTTLVPTIAPMLHPPDLDKDYALRVAYGVLTGVLMKPTPK